MAEIRKIDKGTTNLDNILNTTQEAVLSSLNCHNIGKIVAFHSDTQTVDVELMQVKQYNEQFVTPPLITEIPLIIYGTKDSYITLPDATGTICLLMFMDRNMDSFLETGEQYVPETGRMHDFTDCIAITTFKTMVDKITDYDTTALTIFYQKIINNVAFKSFIKNYGNSLKLNVSNGDDVDSTIEVSDKIKIANKTRNLNTLLQDLVTQIKAITIVNGAVSSASQTALANVATQIGELLQ